MLNAHRYAQSGSYPVTILVKLGSVAGPVIQANGRLSFEDNLRSGGLLYCVSHRGQSYQKCHKYSNSNLEMILLSVKAEDYNCSPLIYKIRGFLMCFCCKKQCCVFNVFSAAF